MPICVQCGAYAVRVVQPETAIVQRCVCCGQPSDKYFEFAAVPKWIDILLLERCVWIHVVFNRRDLAGVLALAALLTCLLEAYVARTMAVFRCTEVVNTSYSYGGTWASAATPGASSLDAERVQTLQFVRNMSPSRADEMRYALTIPRLYAYAVVEYILLMFVVVWASVKLRHQPELVDRGLFLSWVSAASLVYLSKATLLLFLVWHVPMSLLLATDVMYVLWLLRCFRTLSPGASVWNTIAASGLALASRVGFRYVTEWCPQTSAW